MGLVRELTTKFRFKSDGTKLSAVKASVGKTKKELRQASRAAFKLRQEMKKLSYSGKGLVALFVGSRVLKGLTSDFADAADKAAKFSQATGMSMEAYQGLGYAAQLNGVKVEEMDKALQQLAKRSLEVTQGNKTTARAFRALGVSVTDAKGKLRSAEDILLSLGEKVKANPNDKKTIGLLMQVLGRTGAKLIPLLKNGKIGIRQMMEEAKKLGIVLSKEEAAIAEKFNDEKLRTVSILKGLRNQISIRVLPAINNIMRKFIDWAKRGNNLKKALKVLLVVSKLLAAAFALFVAKKVHAAYVSLISVIKRAIVAYRTMGLAAALAQIKVYAIVAAVAGVIWLAKKLYDFSNGKENFLSKFLDPESAIKLRKIIQAVKKDLIKLWNDIQPDIKQMQKSMIELANVLWKDLLKPALPASLAYIKYELIKLKYVFKAISWAVKISVRNLKLFTKAFSGIGKGSIKVLKEMMLAWAWFAGFMSGVAERIFRAFEGPFKRIKKLGATIMEPIMKQIRKVIRIYNKIKSVLGGKKISLSTSIKGAQQREEEIRTKRLLKRRGKIEGTSSKSISVGNVNVAIKGSTGMDKKQVAKAVKDGVSTGIEKMVLGAFVTRSPA